MNVKIFDFDLPQELIALRPAVPRDSAKLLQVDGRQTSDHSVSDLSEILRPGDVLVLNQTKVIPASLTASRAAREHGGGGDVTIQINLHKNLSDNKWRAFARPAKRLKNGDMIAFSTHLSAEVYEKSDGGDIGLEFDVGGTDLLHAIETIGAMPLPPYIGKMRPVDEKDAEDYQTVFAAEKGSVAAPTAGLHFTPELLEKLGKKGVQIETITLHVGAGTFLPVAHSDTNDHKMHAEWYSISEEVADQLNFAKNEGRRVVAVGTTALRALESSVADDGKLLAHTGETSIFITPGFDFKIVDGLMTNFHLPKSTLFMLVCALSGTTTMKSAYQYAMENKYRFYSYGDSSLLWTQKK